MKNIWGCCESNAEGFESMTLGSTLGQPDQGCEATTLESGNILTEGENYSTWLIDLKCGLWLPKVLVSSPPLQERRGRFGGLVATGPDWLGGVHLVPAEGKPLSCFVNSAAIVLRLSSNNALTDSTQTDTPPCPFTFSSHKGSRC